MPLTLHDLKLHILRLVAAESAKAGAHIFNTLGRAHEVGDLERSLGTTFDKEQRAWAFQAFRQLESDGLIRPTLADFINPGDWYEITDAGSNALERGLLDELDDALQAINSHLVEVRRGAWAALESKQPDALRQSAHSGRELIDQVLKDGAPDEAIKEQPWFTSDPTSTSGITRRTRLKYLMQQKRGKVSDSDLKVADKACDLVVALDDKLMASAHGRSAPSYSDLKDTLTTAETALRQILL